MDRVLDDQGPKALMLGTAVDIEDERVAARVLAAGTPAAEPACCERRTLTGPTIHLRSPDGPAQAGTDIMARPRAEFTHGFA